MKVIYNTSTEVKRQKGENPFLIMYFAPHSEFSIYMANLTCKTITSELKLHDFSDYLYSSEHEYKKALRIYFFEYAKKVSRGYTQSEADEFASNLVEKIFDFDDQHERDLPGHTDTTVGDMFMDLKMIFFNERGWKFDMKIPFPEGDKFVTIYHNPANPTKYAQVK